MSNLTFIITCSIFVVAWLTWIIILDQKERKKLNSEESKQYKKANKQITKEFLINIAVVAALNFIGYALYKWYRPRIGQIFIIVMIISECLYAIAAIFTDNFKKIKNKKDDKSKHK